MLDIQDKNAGHPLHQPKLDTIRMVEQFIKDHSGDYKKKALWQNLPKKMMYQTYNHTIEYLLESNKIAMDKNGHIIWIWDPEGAKNIFFAMIWLYDRLIDHVNFYSSHDHRKF